MSIPVVGIGTSAVFPVRLRSVDEADRTVTTIPAAGEMSSSVSGGTVLVVEDEETLRSSVSKLLELRGFSVMTASDGCAALDALRAPQCPIRVILLDVNLPGASSRVVFEEARRLNPDIKVIATSGYGERVAAASLPGAADRFIQKPYKIGDLVQMIRDLLSG